MVVFAEHNALQDPPFTFMDLASCRNLLIYLERDLQNRLLPLFRYALREQGVLFLGPSETPDELTDAFQGENRGWRIYRNKAQKQVGPLPEMPVRKRGQGATAFQGPATAPSGGAGEAFSHSVERLLAVRFAPPAVLVNDRGEVVYIHGRTGQFLEPASGPAQNQLLEMARPGLRAPLSQALREVASGTAESVEQTWRSRPTAAAKQCGWRSSASSRRRPCGACGWWPSGHRSRAGRAPPQATLRNRRARPESPQGQRRLNRTAARRRAWSGSWRPPAWTSRWRWRSPSP
ncbi:CheR family methyltransferase [Thiohalorhabdus sp.]|uniref:CheR family methyltransferase n=1 Tax=Thiohalorhabdus sp. TaxID=3094134 RepID=UPI002FC2C31B